MRLPDGGQATDIDAFVLRETRLPKRPTYAVWPVGAGDVPMNNAMFRPFKNSEMSMASIELKGCTTLYVVSHRGVYMARYKEDISFDPDRDFQPAGETPLQALERTVLRPLRQGNHFDPDSGPGQISLTDFASQLGDNDVRAFLIRPSHSWAQENAMDPPEDQPRPSPAPVFSDDELGDPEHWRRIREQCVAIIPQLGCHGTCAIPRKKNLSLYRH